MVSQTRFRLHQRAASVWDMLRAFHSSVELARSRRALRDLDDHLLRDIGLTREEAEEEARGSAWNVPPHWRG